MSRAILAASALSALIGVGLVVMSYAPKAGIVLIVIGITGLLFLAVVKLQRLTWVTHTLHRGMKTFHASDREEDREIRLLLDRLVSQSEASRVHISDPPKDAAARKKNEKSLGAARQDADAFGKQKKASLSATRPLAGRAATPEVTNAGTDMTLARALSPAWARTRRKVTGVLSAEVESVLNRRQISVLQLRRSAAAQQVKDDDARTLVVDMAALHDGEWAGGATAEGTHIIQELRQVIGVAKEKSMTVVVLPDPSRADIHTKSLYLSDVLVLPFSDNQISEAAGALPEDTALTVLDRVARDRIGERR